jgi:hypothetical protein
MTGIDRSLPNPSTLPLLLISHSQPPSLSFISPSSSRLHPDHSPCVNPRSSPFRSDGRYGCKPSFSLRWHSLFSVPPKVSITRSLSHAIRDTVPIVHSHVALLTRTRNTLCSLCHRRLTRLRDFARAPFARVLASSFRILSVVSGPCSDSTGLLHPLSASLTPRPPRLAAPIAAAAPFAARALPPKAQRSLPS